MNARARQSARRDASVYYLAEPASVRLRDADLRERTAPKQLCAGRPQNHGSCVASRNGERSANISPGDIAFRIEPRDVLEQAMMRKIQSAALVVALFAMPLALVARAFAVGPQECTMSCCPAHHAMRINMNCGHAGSRGQCPCMNSNHSQQMPDYGLAAPIAPTELSAAVTLQAPQVRRASFGFAILKFTSGYSFPPFEPPRE